MVCVSVWWEGLGRNVKELRNVVFPCYFCCVLLSLCEMFRSAEMFRYGLLP